MLYEKLSLRLNKIHNAEIFSLQIINYLIDKKNIHLLFKRHFY